MTWVKPLRLERAEHTHIVQAEPDAPVEGCQACALIRPPVMTVRAARWLKDQGVPYGLEPIRNPD